MISFLSSCAALFVGTLEALMGCEPFAFFLAVLLFLVMFGVGRYALRRARRF